MTGAPGDSERLYVVEQRGTIQVLEDGVARPFLDLRHVVRGPDDPDAGGEEGMTSMAFAPDFQATRRFYVYYTTYDGRHNRVDEFRASTGEAADPASQRLVIAIPHFEGSHHNGGGIDQGEYRIPAGNPYAGQPGRRAEIWASGLRNPFRFSFDRLTGDLTIATSARRRRRRSTGCRPRRAAGAAPTSAGAPARGRFRRGSTDPCPLVGSVLPTLQRTRADGYRSIIAGYVVRDPSLPSLYGRLVYGDFYLDALRSVALGPAGASDDREIGPLAAVPRLTLFGEDAGGCVYATSISGAVYRLVENDVRVPCATEVPYAPEDLRPPAPRGARARLTLTLRVRDAMGNAAPTVSRTVRARR